jgi:HSP20 family protein
MLVRFLPTIGGRRSGLARTDLDPFNMFQREIDRLFTDFRHGWPAQRDFDLSPRLDVTERENDLAITVELPGLEDKDVKVELMDDILTISGEKKAEREEKGENRHLVERSYGTFSRSLQLPNGVKPEDIRASMAKGVLTVTVPKPAVAQSEAKEIEVKPVE